jgi:hypothetical protein
VSANAPRQQCTLKSTDELADTFANDEDVAIGDMSSHILKRVSDGF